MTPPVAATAELTWGFGGALVGVSPLLAWATLAVAAVLGAGWIVVSYRRSMVTLPLARRVTLIALRVGLLGGFLVILAAPTRTIRRVEGPPPPRPLAVLIDASDSMTQPDNQHHRRLDDALRRWQGMEAVARRTHADLQTFTFAQTVRTGPPGTGAPGIPTAQTALFSALRSTLENAPAGGWGEVVTLTDGLDTTSESAAAAVESLSRLAAQKQTTLHFLPGRNRYAGGPFVALREFKAPTHVAPKGKVRLEVVVDSFQLAPRELPVDLQINGEHRPTEKLRLGGGRKLATWSTLVDAPEAGVLDATLRIGAETVRAEIRVSRPANHHILYYSGALDWSYRFLADVLNRDTAFVLTPVFDLPNPHAALPPGALRRLPEIPRELDAYDIVVLANASAAQFTPDQQAGLTDWVSRGGVVVFFTPDDDSTEGFAGSEIEKMLPVLFEPATHANGGVAARAMTSYAGGLGGSDHTVLSSFVWEATPRVAEIFAEAGRQVSPPRFAEFAHGARPKPGAEVLARHPSERGPDGDKAVLLAIQRYGHGHAVALTTDALWRWRLDLPSDQRDPDLFWRSLFAWLTRQRESGFRFEDSPRLAAMDAPVALRVAGGVGTPTVEATLGRDHITLPSTGTDAGTVRYDWRPHAAGLWRLTARDERGDTAAHWISVRAANPAGELSGAPPDEELLAQLAVRTGGEVLEHAPPAAWTAPAPAQSPVGEHRQPLWHQPWVFGLLLAAYGTDLILRRIWRLL